VQKLAHPEFGEMQLVVAKQMQDATHQEGVNNVFVVAVTCHALVFQMEEQWIVNPK
jgi:prophage DNA circulation protein